MAHLIDITASQAGPAHSHLLGAALQAAAEQGGHTLQLQVVSRLGTQGSFTPADIQRAAAIVVAADMDVESGQLPADKLHSATHDAVFADAGLVLRQALQQAQAAGAGGAAGATATASRAATAPGANARLRIACSADAGGHPVERAVVQA